MGFNFIDATIVPHGGEYLLFLKDEMPEPSQKNIRVSRARQITGPYGSPSPPITGDYLAEGPTVIKINKNW